MVSQPGQLVVEAVLPTNARARRVLRAYMDDVVSRYYGRPATDEEIDAAIAADPSDDLAPPHGLFLIAHRDGIDVGCVGLRVVSERIGEVKRLSVVPAARGSGIGFRLMRELETVAAEHSLVALRLETRTDLVEARRLYERMGYREVDPFNDGPYAEHWFLKKLKGSEPHGAHAPA